MNVKLKAELKHPNNVTWSGIWSFKYSWVIIKYTKASDNIPKHLCNKSGYLTLV